jgi:hypothetical protein
MLKLRDSLKRLIGRFIYMFRKEISIVLLALDFSLLFTASQNLMRDSSGSGNWIALTLGILGIFALWYLFKRLEVIEKRDRDNENTERDLRFARVLRDILKEDRKSK